MTFDNDDGAGPRPEQRGEGQAEQGEADRRGHDRRGSAVVSGRDRRASFVTPGSARCKGGHRGGFVPARVAESEPSPLVGEGWVRGMEAEAVSKTPSP